MAADPLDLKKGLKAQFGLGVDDAGAADLEGDVDYDLRRCIL